MDHSEKEEFWKALGHLYEATRNLYTATECLVTATEALRDIAQVHERRIERLEGGNA